MRFLGLRFVLGAALIACFVSVGIATVNVLAASETRMPLVQIVFIDMITKG